MARKPSLLNRIGLRSSSRFSATSGRHTASARRLTAQSTPDVAVTQGNRPSNRDGKREKWQDDAWTYFDEVGEVKYAGRYSGRSIGRLIPVPGYKPTPDATPIPIDDLAQMIRDSETDEINVDGVTPQLIADAKTEVARVRSAVGGVASLLTTAGINMFIAGELYLIGTPVHATPEMVNPFGGRPLQPAAPNPDDVIGETWEVRSVRELVKHPERKDRWQIREAGEKPIDLPEDAIVIRIWNPHPASQSKADSSLRGALTTCEDLQLLSRSIRARKLSTLAGAGILLVSDALTFGGKHAQTPDGEDEEQDQFLLDFMDNMLTPIEDPGSAAAVVPFLVRVPADEIEKSIVFVDPSRQDTSAEDRAEREERRDTLAIQLDMPPEVLTGKGQSNHWSAWQIDEDMFRGHVEPPAQVIFDGWTAALFRPAMLEHGHTPEVVDRLCVWYDASQLVIRPNRAQDAKDAHASGVISDAALRDAIGMDDSDAPDQDEIARRLIWDRGMIDAGITSDLIMEILGFKTTPVRARSGGSGSGQGWSDDTAPADGTSDGQGPPAAALELTVTTKRIEAGRSRGRRALTAGGKQEPDYSQLGPALLNIDRDLRTKILTAADAALTSAIERAGAKVKARVSGGGSGSARYGAMNDVVRDLPARLVTGTLGQRMVQAAGYHSDDLLKDAFTSVGEQFRRFCIAAQRQAATAMHAHGGVPLPTATAYFDGQTTALDTAHDRFVGDLSNLAAADLWSLDPDNDQEGEGSDTLGVPVSLARAAIALAGGAVIGDWLLGGSKTERDQLVPDEDNAWTGLAQSAGVRDLLASEGVEEQGYVWNYGVSDRAFPPHLDLDGIEVSTLDDEALVNDNGFPYDFAYFTPGDHEGCNCDLVPLFAAAAVENAIGDEPTSEE